MLLELRGLDLVNAILDMQAAKAKVTLESISAWLLETRDLYVPPSGTHISTFNAWLCKAGVLKGLYPVDDDRLQEIIGVSVQEVEELADLTEEQRTFLRALGNLAHFGPILSNKVAQYAQELYGVKFSTKSLPSQVLTPLEEAGYIVKTKTTGGRGAKPFVFETTPKFKKQFIESVLDTIEQSTGFDYRRLYRQSLDEILEELKSKSKNVRGRALEALAIFFMRLLDLQLVAWRLRAESTGWAEVDIVVEGTRFIFSRWQIQCKHTPRSAVRLDDVAKEVGLAQALNSNVVMVVSTGRFTEDARQFARFMMEKTNLQIILLDQRDLATLESQPTDIVVILRREAENAMQLKKHQLEILGT
jgi:site-specific DNA-methyltransferase (cytosine-N4-specific)